MLYPLSLGSIFDVLEKFPFSSAPTPSRRFDAWWGDDALGLAFEIPGFEKGKISVLVEGGVLTVSASRETKDEERKYVVQSLSSENFSQTIHLPDGLDESAAEANYENGVLTVTVPKAASDKKEKKYLEIK